MINVGAVVSGRLAQSFTVYRKNGTWTAGRWTPGADTTILMTGVITIPKETDLDQVSEGDRVKGAIQIHTQAQLYLTNPNGTSDELVYNGQRYRLAQLWDMSAYGYYKAVAVRMDDE